MYSAKRSDRQVKVDSSDISPDPGASAKAAYYYTKSNVYRASRVMSNAECTTLATALVNRYQYPTRAYAAVLPGNAFGTYDLGDEISVTSTHFNLSAKACAIVRWTYSMRTDRTTIHFVDRDHVFTDLQYSPLRIDSQVREVTTSVAGGGGTDMDVSIE